MKRSNVKYFLFLALIFLSNFASAEWIYYGSKNSDSGRIDYFYDGKINGPKSKKRMWLLTDYEAPQEKNGISYQSMRNLAIFDCNKDMYYFAQISFHSMQGARGSTLKDFSYQESEASKENIPPSSLMGKFFDIACAK